MPSTFVISVSLAVLCVVNSYPAEQISYEKAFGYKEDMDNSTEKDELGVSALIEKANRKLGQGPDEPLVRGDIAVYSGLQNADPCTARGCMWKKSSDGKVYVPYTISKQYSSRERSVIEKGLRSFAASTCIVFKPRTREQDFVDIKSLSGCFSFVGRRGGSQDLSLSRRGCVYHGVIQHELLHALGFNHEQTRSDRDSHIRILYENIIPSMKYNFRKIATNNLGTPYDYNSVMQYERYAFSKNRHPTMVPIPNSNAVLGRATEMNSNDILRVNRLYGCKSH